MPYTMEDFRRDFTLERFPELPPDYQRKVLQKLPAEVIGELYKAMASEVFDPWMQECRTRWRESQATQSAPKRKPRRKR